MSQPQPPRSSEPARQSSNSNEKKATADDAPRTKRAQTEDEGPRKWEVEGGAPVSAEDRATFT